MRGKTCALAWSKGGSLWHAREGGRECFLLYWWIDLRFGSLGGLPSDHIILGVLRAREYGETFACLIIGTRCRGGAGEQDSQLSVFVHAWPIGGLHNRSFAAGSQFYTGTSMYSKQ